MLIEENARRVIEPQMRTFHEALNRLRAYIPDIDSDEVPSQLSDNPEFEKTRNIIRAYRNTCNELLATFEDHPETLSPTVIIAGIVFLKNMALSADSFTKERIHFALSKIMALPLESLNFRAREALREIE